MQNKLGIGANIRKWKEWTCGELFDVSRAKLECGVKKLKRITCYEFVNKDACMS